MPATNSARSLVTGGADAGGRAPLARGAGGVGRTQGAGSPLQPARPPFARAPSTPGGGVPAPRQLNVLSERKSRKRVSFPAGPAPCHLAANAASPPSTLRAAWGIGIGSP